MNSPGHKPPSCACEDTPANGAGSDTRPLDPIPDEKTFLVEGPEDEGLLRCSFFAFNTRVSIGLYMPGDMEEAAAHSILGETMKACRRYERLFSRTLPHSDIALLNAARGKAVRIERDTFDLLLKAVRYCAESEGAFDVTIGRAVRLWDFHDGIIPDRAELLETLSHVNWRLLKLSDSGDASGDGSRFFAQLADPDASVDVGGIAKGWIADALCELLKREGARAFIIDLGGNIAVDGVKPDGTPWRIGVRDPANPAAYLASIPIEHGSVVTSGIYERAFTLDGKSYHHILDPRTGAPVETDLASATLVCEKSIDAEGFSTTVLALGSKRARAFVLAHPTIIHACLVDKDGRIFTI